MALRKCTTLMHQRPLYLGDGAYIDCQGYWHQVQFQQQFIYEHLVLEAYIFRGLVCFLAWILWCVLMWWFKHIFFETRTRMYICMIMNIKQHICSHMFMYILQPTKAGWNLSWIYWLSWKSEPEFRPQWNPLMCNIKQIKIIWIEYGMFLSSQFGQ